MLEICTRQRDVLTYMNVKCRANRHLPWEAKKSGGQEIHTCVRTQRRRSSPSQTMRCDGAICAAVLMPLRTRSWILGVLLLLAACGGEGGGSSSVAPSGAYITALDYIEAENFVGSVLVSRDGVDVVRTSFGFSDSDNQLRNGSDTRYRIGSITKSFTALAIVQLREFGLIDSYDDPVSAYLPDYPGGNEITIRHLLTHRSGIPDYLGWVNQSSFYTPAQLVALFMGRDLAFSPGTRFSYSNSNYVLLGNLIETISGMDYPTYLQANVFSPLGLINTAPGTSDIVDLRDAKGYKSISQGDTADYLNMSIPFSAGALVSTIGDLEHWGRSYLDRTLLSTDSYDELFVDGEYGFGWAGDRFGGKSAYWHDGGINGFSAIIALFPEQRGMVIALSNVQNESAKLQRIVATMAENEL